MLTIVLDQPGSFRITDTAEPPAPGPGEALVQVKRVGICGTDLHAFHGNQPFFSYPRILGHELGVEVLALGPGTEATGLAVGDRCAVEPCMNCGKCLACRRGRTNCCESLQLIGVHLDGGMRERIVVPADKLHKSTLPLEQLATVEMLCIGAHAVSRAEPEPGESTLVIGAGPIGLATAQFALLAGADVTMLEISAPRRAFAREHLGVERMLDGQGDPVAQVRDALGGELPSLVFDATGNPASMNGAFNLVANSGKLVFVGLGARRVDLYRLGIPSPRDDAVEFAQCPRPGFPHGDRCAGGPALRRCAVDYPSHHARYFSHRLPHLPRTGARGRQSHVGAIVMTSPYAPGTLFSLQDKVAVVTGGTGVLGGAMAHGLAAAGAKVAILGRRAERAAEVAAEIEAKGGEAMPLPADVLDKGQLDAARHTLVSEWGTVDILINAAGGNTAAASVVGDHTFFKLERAALDDTVALNFMGTVLPSQVFGEVMAEKQQGSIVNISSMSSQRTLTRVIGYAAAKAAIDNYTRWLSVEFALRYGPGLRVNAIAPGFFLGDQNRALLVNEDGTLTPRGQTIVDHTPMGRFGEPEELIGTAVWLCSEAAHFITGIVVPVDGGFMAYGGV